MLGLIIMIGNTLRVGSIPVVGVIWRTWTTSWTSLNKTWNSYK